ncbi:MAG: hypothetical protein GF330_08535 [Candidatus Eisenbacteria bacterium]|nr:hypothetical protein [Candidatus Eisenbacteria bacterium]
MSHIYDALRKSDGEEPPRRGTSQGEAEDAARSDDSTRAEDPADAAAGPAVTPQQRIEGSLFDSVDLEFLEELDTLRSSIDVTLGRTAHRVIGFIGSAPDEGTSTVASHYAYLLARVVAKQVLLIDADTARTNLGLSEPFGDREGFAELVEEEQPLAQVVLETEEPKLHFLPAGRDRVHHVEAVGSGRLRPIFERCAEAYQAVVVDIAPALMIPEAPLIAAACDGVVVVVRAHQTRREIVRRAMTELNFAKCRVLGTVLNARRETLPRFLRERV